MNRSTAILAAACAALALTASLALAAGSPDTTTGSAAPAALQCPAAASGQMPGSRMMSGQTPAMGWESMRAMMQNMMRGGGPGMMNGACQPAATVSSL